MDVQIQDLEKSQKEINFSLTPEDMASYLDNAASKLAQSMNIKGFREGGDIPRNVVENSVGKEKVWQEALPEAIEENYWKTIEEKDIKAIGRPEVNVTKMVPGSELEFKAIVPVLPEDIQLPDYKEIAKQVFQNEKQEVKVEEKDMEEAINWLRKTKAQKSEESTQENGSDTDSETEGGSTNEEENLPELNDEFAKSVGDFNNVEELKENIREGLLQEKEQQENQRLRLKVIEEIRNNTDINVPDSLIQQEIEKMKQEFSQQVEQAGMNMEDYLQKAGKTEEDLKEDWKDKAEDRVASAILLRLIADKENIKPSEEEIEEEANKYLEQFGNPEEAQKNISPEQIKSYVSGIMRNEKVFELLEGSSK